MLSGPACGSSVGEAQKVVMSTRGSGYAAEASEDTTSSIDVQESEEMLLPPAPDMVPVMSNGDDIAMTKEADESIAGDKRSCAGEDPFENGDPLEEHYEDAIESEIDVVAGGSTGHKGGLQHGPRTFTSETVVEVRRMSHPHTKSWEMVLLSHALVRYS